MRLRKGAPSGCHPSEKECAKIRWVWFWILALAFIQHRTINCAGATLIAWGSGLAAPLKPIEDAVSVSAGRDFALVLKGDGTVLALGTHWNGYTNVSMDPPFPITNAVAVSAGVAHAMALKNDGTVAAWGDGTAGQTNVPAGLSNVIAIAAGGAHNLALKADRTVVTWGSADYGATAVPKGLTNVVAIAASAVQSLALQAGGKVIGWGRSCQDNSIRPPSGLENVRAIAAGCAHCVALIDDGTVVVWGDNSAGPIDSPPSLKNVVAISAGERHTLALQRNGLVAGWGFRSGTNQITVPKSATNVIAIAGGGGFSLALKGDSKPVIFGQPQALSSQGQPLGHLQVFVSGRPPMEYQWYAGTAGDTSLPIFGGTTDVLAFPVSVAATSFWCRASNSFGVADSAAATLPAVAIVSEPEGQTISEPQPVTLRARAFGTALVTYQWFEGAQGETNRPVIGANGPTLVTPPIWKETSYWVRASSGPFSVDSRAAAIRMIVAELFEFLGSSPGAGDFRKTAVEGNFAYVAAGESGLQILDVAIPARTVRIAALNLGRYASDIQVVGTRAYLAAGDGLEIVDVADPRKPAVLGRFIAGGIVLAVQVSGPYAYLTRFTPGDFWGGPGLDYGLDVVDVTDPAKPQRIGSLGLDLPIQFYGGSISVAGSIACVEGSGGLHLVDISNPAEPRLKAVYDTGGHVIGVQAAARGIGAYAFIIDSFFGWNGQWSGSLQVLDIGDPQRPVLTGFHILAGPPAALQLSGSQITVSGTTGFGSGFVELLDVSNPRKPVLLSGRYIRAAASGVARAGGYTYLSEGPAGLEILFPSFFDSWPVAEHYELENVRAIKVVEGIAYEAAGPAGLQLIDVRDSRQPAVIARMAEVGEAQSIDVQANLAFVGTKGSGLRIVDVSIPAQPKDSSFWLNVEISDVKVEGDLVFLAEGFNGLEILRLGPGSTLDRIGGYDSPGFSAGLAKMGNFVFLADGSAGLEVIDVSDPAHPRWAGGTATGENAVAVQTSRGYVFVADSAIGLVVIDPGNSANPKIVATWRTKGAVTALEISGNTAYLGLGAAGLEAIDITDPRQPALLGTARGEFYGLQSSGPLLFAAAGLSGVSVFQANPLWRVGILPASQDRFSIVWTGGPGPILQKSQNLLNPIWQDMLGTEKLSSIEISRADAASFFRLKQSGSAPIP